uniref:E3 ubiquitin-protein ligase n=1 Tax=Caenorhabditis japonica TaxID=281687 RepID=A0A8R1EFU2_CAEJA
MPVSADSVRKKGHSRKRSHSERSLLDLEKQAQTKEPDTANTSAGVLAYAAAHSDVSSTNQMHDIAATEHGSMSPPYEDVDFYNELAAMFVDHEAVAAAAAAAAAGGGGAASPTATPESTPVSTSTQRSNESPHSDSGKKSETGKKIQHALYALIRPFPALINSNRICSSALDGFEEPIKDLGKNMINFRRRGSELKTKFIEKHLKGYAISTVTWQSTAHVTRAISSYLHYDKKPLFGALNTRQRDCLSAMARLCASLSHNMQFLLHAVSDMLRVLLCEPPRAKVLMSQSPGTSSSPLLGASTSASTSSSAQTPSLPSSGTNFAFLVQLFNPAGPRKNVNLNILQVDILSLAVSLMMTIGWTWNNGVQSMSSTTHQKARTLTPDGSVDEAYVLRLSLLAHYFQIIATHDESDGDDVDMVDEEEAKCHVDPEIADTILKLFSLCRPDDIAPRRIDLLHKKMEEGAQSMLRPIALLYHFLTLVDPPEALKDPSINSSEALFRYLGLPPKMEDQIGSPLVENLFSMWSAAIPRDAAERHDLVVQPVRPNLLVELPEKYSSLINQVATFKCPTIPIEESTSNVPTLCLVCGVILCSQAYCCQKIVSFFFFFFFVEKIPYF